MMAINDQIKDEKLQYNINREAAKISALSSGKLHKYEYLTGEDILPSTQQQIIEQTKFTYSPLGRAFDKQIKTIEDQGKKQVDALNTLKSDNKITIKKYTYDLNDTPFISKQKEIFNKLLDVRLEKITDLDKKVNIDDLIYRCKGRLANTKFDEFYNSLGIINKIRDGKKDLAEIKNDRQKFKLYSGEIKKGAKKSKEQKNTIYNIEKLYKARNEAIKFCDDYSLMMSEAKSKAKQNETKGTGLRILTPKRMLQRLPIALAQVKAGNSSENLLNEIRQIIYLLYQSKEITKKYATT